MIKLEFSVGDRVVWNYGIGKGKGYILEKVMKMIKFVGKNFKVFLEEFKYFIKSDKGKFFFFIFLFLYFLFYVCYLKYFCG